MEEIKDIEEKLLILEKNYEQRKNSLPEKEKTRIEGLFDKITTGLENLKKNNYKLPHEKKGEFISIMIFMNKIYERIGVVD